MKNLFLLIISLLLYTGINRAINIRSQDNSTVQIGLEKISYVQLSDRKKRKKLVKYAKQFVGAPYRYGGTTPRGFDCSGFTQYIYKHLDIDIPHGSQAQSKVGGKKKKLRKAKPGDIIVFGEKKRRRKYSTQHVALVIENKKGVVTFIHAASTGVRIDNTENTNWKSYWEERYLFIRRVID